MTHDLFDDNATGAIFSDCRTWRYRLWRRWSDAPACLFVILNPSTADEMKNDPTVAKCQRWAQAWGFGLLEVCNLFAYRATDPRDMKAAADPVGPDNDWHILRAAKEAGLVVCAWGTHGTHRDRAPAVVRLLRDAGVRLHALAFTKDGHPGHPLYLPNCTTPARWSQP